VSTGDLERRLQALEDREAIASLVYGYASALDEGRWGDYEDCFTDDAELEYSWGSVRGREGLGARVGEMLQGYTYMQHAISNLELELDGDSARGRADFIVTLANDNHPEGRWWQELGYYLHAYRRTSDGWKFSRLDCVSKLQTRGATRPGARAAAEREELRTGG
jgi:3-phenylpropionate/cinnamic acid dioxygenase small subunit